MSWKTSLGGVLMIVVAVGSAALTWLKTGAVPDLAPVFMALSGGIALMKARDNDKTSEQVGAK